MTGVSEGPGEVREAPVPVPAGERGATRIADRVVAKIAARAAREALGVLHPDAERPYATVVVHHDTARVRVHVELDYPCDIGARCGQVRHHVVQQVRGLAGMAVPEVGVEVERLHLAAEYGARQRRTR
ncbi:Asp23/Gls24 family envelope stress response protein [Streptomyces sp. NPDC093586]|uniref:Asp23/Gls24 family envelope stress response protein n=1 Tax=Streptomyces sp. NPDC093586 TaxID=3366042 RepID=UPI00381E991C